MHSQACLGKYNSNVTPKNKRLKFILYSVEVMTVTLSA